jgi:hypothetical protein
MLCHCVPNIIRRVDNVQHNVDIVMTQSLVQKFLLTYSMEQSFLEKLTGLQLVKKFPAFYGIRRLIAAFKIARHLSILSQLNSVHPPKFHLLKIALLLYFHLRLGLSSGLFP